MSYQHEREQFVSIATNAGLPLSVAQIVLRHANTIQRTAVAQCNGDWPYDDGCRTVTPCSRCEAGSAVRTKAGLCPSCVAEDRIRKALPEGIEPDFQGDPRGYTVRLKIGAAEIGVPTRHY